MAGPPSGPPPSSNDSTVIKDPDEVTLTSEQEAAVQKIMTSNDPVIYLTGKAGTGKSTIVRHLRNKYNVTTCATTGRAAVVAGSGITVDSLFGINRSQWTINRRRAQENLESASEVIVVDEASMVGAKMFPLILAGATANYNRIIMVGDWAQAAPVMDDWITTHPAFDPSGILCLQECHRQADHDMVSALDSLRIGEPNAKAHELFGSRAGIKPSRKALRLYATRAAVQSENTTFLREHCMRASVEPFSLESNFSDLRDARLKNRYPMKQNQISKEIDNSRLAHKERFALGCRVMITWNAVSAAGGAKEYVNGDTGNIVDVHSKLGDSAVNDRWIPDPSRIDSFSILLDRNQEIVRVRRTDVELKQSETKTKGKVRGFPLALGYAMTIHKAQGATAPCVHVSMDSLRRFRDSKHGLAYVALSRTTSLEGLTIDSWKPEFVECDQAVRPLVASLSTGPETALF
jgi:ATP-dependent DNA helicase PIF1